MVVAGLASVALGQGVFKYTDASGTLTIQAKSATATQDAGGALRFALSGGVVADSRTQGLHFACASLKAQAASAKGNSKQHMLQSAHAGGGVTVIKTLSTGVTTLKGSTAIYQRGSNEDSISLAGPVIVQNANSAKKSVLSASGSSGKVLLVSGLTGKNPIRSATLDGNVSANLSQAPVKGKPASNVKATGSHMVLDNLSEPPTVTLTGSVKIVGTGDNSFTLQNVSKAVLRLNDNGEVTGFEVAH